MLKMKLLLILPFCLIQFSLFSQIDSSTTYKKNTIMALVSPKDQLAVGYRHHFKQFAFHGALHYFHYNSHYLPSILTEPDFITDSSIVYQNTFRKDNRYELHLGSQYTFGFVDKFGILKIRPSVGLDLGIGIMDVKYDLTYTTFYFDTTGAVIENDPVPNFLPIQRSQRFASASVTPYSSVDFSFENFPVSFGLRYGGETNVLILLRDRGSSEITEVMGTINTEFQSRFLFTVGFHF